jgi:hypothetical protein
LTLCRTSLFLTQSVQLIASILLQHQISYYNNCLTIWAVRCTICGHLYPGVTREAGHNKGCGPLPQKVWSPLVYVCGLDSVNIWKKRSASLAHGLKNMNSDA